MSVDPSKQNSLALDVLEKEVLSSCAPEWPKLMPLSVVVIACQKLQVPVGNVMCPQYLRLCRTPPQDALKNTVSLNYKLR